MGNGDNRHRFSVTLSEALIANLKSRIPEIGKSRNDVIERLLSRFWDAKMDIADSRHVIARNIKEVKSEIKKASG
jgi:metal-responsive CopG/Arc/MetJ family transcriptional regulator